MSETDDVNRFSMRTNQTPAKLPAIKVSGYSRRTTSALRRAEGSIVTLEY